MSHPIVVVGSVAFDSVETPFGREEKILGGAANYFSIGASFFTPIQMVAVVGKDFPEEHIQFLNSKGIDTKGLERTDGKTFHWTGRYGFDLNAPETLDTQLNCFADFKPKLPEDYAKAKYLFLANIDPSLQMDVLDQMTGSPLVGMDTMNFWLETRKDDVLKVLKRVDILIINDGEARQLADTPWLVTAARKIREMGPKVVVIKKGEHGALIFFEDNSVFSAPALPIEEVRDPTGAGDTFASGFFGYMAKMEAGLRDVDVLKQSVIYGSLMASFTVEDFSFNRLKKLKTSEIEARYEVFKRLTHF